MSNEADTSPVKPTVIDLDPDDVTVEREDAPAPGETVETPPPPAKTSSSYRVIAFAVALGIGAIAGGWLYRDMLSPYFPSNTVQVLSDRLDALGKGHETLATQMQGLERLAEQLTADVNALETATSSSASDSKALADGLVTTKQNIAALESAVAETKATLADVANRAPVAAGGSLPPPAAISAEVTERIAALEKDVAALKAQKSGLPDAAALTQTLADLKAKVEAGASFADESDRIARLLPAAGGLDVLATHAASGLPNAKGLATELAAIKPGLPTPEINIVPQEPGLWDRIGDALSAVITVRDLDAVNWQQVAEKAIAFAEAGDLAQAIAAVDEPEGALPAALQQWRDRAAARLSLEAAVANVAAAAARVQAAGQ